MSHTFAIMEVSPATYREIREKMEFGGYGVRFINAGDRGAEVIDMHGVALQADHGCFVPTCHQPRAERGTICETHWQEAERERKLPLIEHDGRWVGWLVSLPGKESYVVF